MGQGLEIYGAGVADLWGKDRRSMGQVLEIYGAGVGDLWGRDWGSMGQCVGQRSRISWPCGPFFPSSRVAL